MSFKGSDSGMVEAVSKREANKARKLAALEDTALGLFLELGYDPASIEMVVAKAEIARGTFYLYFGGKAALFRHVLNRLLIPVEAALLTCRDALAAARNVDEARQAYLALAASLTQLVLGHPRVALLFYREQRHSGEAGEWLGLWSARTDDVVTDMVRSLMERNLLRRTDPRVVALAILGATDRLAFAALSGNDLGDPVALGEEVVRLFGEGLV
ncbi:MAG: TetR/AcrR family transcriptional regulator [Myxococcota bacterium]